MQRVFGVAVFVAALTALLFLLAGRWDWWPGWGFLGVAVTGISTTTLSLMRHDPELVEYRSRLGKDTQRPDYWFLGVFGVAFVGVLVVGPLDAGRFLWAPLPPWAFAVGAVLFVCGEALAAWSMHTNTFFEKTVRLQTDRNHRVIASGPYAIIRHPGYVGFIIGYALGFPLMLTSAWALVPAAIAIASVVVRTGFEDRFLADQLDGYTAYQQKVRYRLLPGIW